MAMKVQSAWFYDLLSPSEQRKIDEKRRLRAKQKQGDYHGGVTYARSPTVRSIVDTEKTKATYELQMSINGGPFFKASDFSGFTEVMLGTYEIKTRMVQVSGVTHTPKKLKNSARKSDPMKYQVHLVRNFGSKEGEMWIPMGCYRHLKNAYKKVNHTRDHYLRSRQHHRVLHKYTLFIEFRASGMVRAFDLVPSYNLNLTEVYATATTRSFPHTHHTTARYTPKSWVLMETSKIRKPKKRKAKVKESTSFTKDTTPAFLKRPAPALTHAPF